MVVLVAALPPGRQEAGRLKHAEVLGHRLASQGKVVVCREADAEFKERLAVPLMECVKEGTSGWGCERFIQISHDRMIGKSPLACQAA